MEETRRVVITGIGPITSIGIGRDEFWENLLNKKISVSEIPQRFERNHKFRSRFYVPFPEFSIEDYGIPSKYNSLMEETSKLSLVGSILALHDAGFNGDDLKSMIPENLQNSMVILGIGIGALRTALYQYAIQALSHRPEILEELDVYPRYNRMAIPSIMPNSATSWVTILFGITGPNFTINTSCSSGTYAIGEAYQKISRGSADMIISGGIECLKDNVGATMRGFDTLGTLTKSDDGKPLPFSKQRSGFLFSEGGGCILILEELESARKRNAPIYCEIVGYASNSDAYNVVQMQPSGDQVKKLITGVIGENKIDYLNTHGTATLLNDEIEAMIIQDLFGNKETQPLINSTKGNLGHSIGAAGAIEIAVTALSVKENRIHANLSEDLIDNLNIANKTINHEVNFALSASYGFGGHNSVILLKKYTER
ncbi:MAG: beta-ketoacyl-[acyl-carrier-protein] synthase family protein [Bacteroidales bacterium]|nr:MAG: beta-ketoacyl-[acyl-carrier-protein] synthase family protein [Bacteroidales bacterium]